MKRNEGAIEFKGNPMTLLGNMVKEGDKAPDFVALQTNLQPLGLKDYEGKIKVISVVPSVDTEVCAMQTRNFNKMAAEFNDVHILTISCDLPFALNRFCAAEGIDKVVTLSDHKETNFGLNYGFLIEELRLLARGIVVIDKNNIIKHVEYVAEATNHPNYDKTLEVIKQITE